MTLLEKLSILADGAKYDASCASCGSTRSSNKGIGANSVAGICHTWTPDGRCVSLLKILLSNDCVYNCKYCYNRLENDHQRATFLPEEIGRLTLEFYKRNYIEGLFLSSAVLKNPDYTMEQLVLSVKKLREEFLFGGYIHLKVIPGADARLVSEAGLWVDRLSVNIEMPTQSSLHWLAPQKKEITIVQSMQQMKAEILSSMEDRKRYAKAPLFAPGGQSTQMVVGASPDTDYDIIGKSNYLYKEMELRRVYYSAFIPVRQDGMLPTDPLPPLKRENRLYQADWLIRVYKFNWKELLNPVQPNLPMDVDPKTHWALAHFDWFPVEINRADFSLLIRIPGIGIQSARKIIQARSIKAIQIEDLKPLHVSTKRAKYFITVNGKSLLPNQSLYPERIREKIADTPPPSLFETGLTLHSAVSGEL